MRIRPFNQPAPRLALQLETRCADLAQKLVKRESITLQMRRIAGQNTAGPDDFVDMLEHVDAVLLVRQIADELAEYRVETPQEVVAPGDRIFVKVLSVDRKRRRIELSVRRAAEFSG